MTTIRTARPADRARLRSIQTAALAEPWPALLDAAIELDQVLVRVDAGDVVGYAVAIGAGGGPAYVPEFAVAPAAQGQGHGAGLLSALLDRLTARSHPFVRVTVLETDERAVGFYRSHGFSMVERRPDAYESGAGLVLERTLDG